MHLLTRITRMLYNTLKGPVVVTGATGYIASHIVRVLLEQGFQVRATVRDPSNMARLKVRKGGL